MTILAILELAHPYQGVVTISNAPFRYALSRMEAAASYKMADPCSFTRLSKKSGGLAMQHNDRSGLEILGARELRPKL